MKAKIYILLFGVGLFCLGCKKYPENTLLFKNPKKLHPFIGTIRKYNVNRIDSLDLLNFYFVEKPYPFEKNMRKCNFYTTKETDYYRRFVYPDASAVIVEYDLIKKIQRCS